MYRTIALTSLLYLAGMLTPVYPQSPDFGSDSIKCLGSLSVMSEFARLELYDEAYDAWKYCFTHCPSASRNIYIIGASILKHRIDNSKEEALRNRTIDTLMLLYDRRMDNFGQKGYVLGRKALDLMTYRPSETDTIYSMLKESVAETQANAEAAVLGNLMQVSSVMYRKKSLSASAVIEDYFTVLDYLYRSPSLTTDQRDRIVDGLIDILLQSGAATCRTVQDFFLPNLDEYSASEGFLKSIVSLMGRMDCVASELNLKASGLLYESDPTPEMALYLANAFLEAGEPASAYDLYAKALELENDPTVQAGIYCQMSLVTQQQGEYSSARDLAQKALALKPGMGEAYLAIGLAYAASAENCGENAFERQAVYWAATDKFAEAAIADQGVRDKAEALILQYSPYFPDNETAFFYGYNEGDTYHVGCWINENTLVRTNKIVQ